jgi:hypothetical protein
VKPVTEGNDTRQIEETIGVVLARRARAASDGALVCSVVLSVVFGVMAATWRVGVWIPTVCAVTAVAAFGLWGIVDRQLTDPLLPPSVLRDRSLRAVKLLLVVLGAAGLAVAFAFVMRGVLGTWIS